MVVDLALKRLEALGVEVRYDTGATALVLDGDSISGATWKRSDETGAIKAGAVVIAAGGFVLNPEMVETYAPQLGALSQRGMALGNTYDDGLGIRLGESVGGVADHMEGAFFTGPFYPPGRSCAASWSTSSASDSSARTSTTRGCRRSSSTSPTRRPG